MICDPDAQAAAALARARAVHPELSERAAAGAREPGCDDGAEPRPNSPEDVGFTNLQTSKPAAPLHSPRVCKSCGAPIYWAQILDEAGQRIRGEGGRFRAMPVNSQSDPGGNVVLFHREGEGIVCRVLRRGEEPPPGARLRTSHFSNCPNANKHRRSSR